MRRPGLRLAVTAGLAVPALVAAGCGSEDHRSEPRPPVPLEVAMSYDMPTGPKLQFEQVLSLGIDRPLPIAKLDHAVKVDGKLDEWGELPIACTRPARVRGDATSWKGPDDGSFHFAVALDDENLYLAVNATDDRVIPQSSRNPFTHDGIEAREEILLELH